MANFCKKSSLSSIAGAIKNATGKSSELNFPTDFVAEINGIELVETKSNPNVLLHKTNTSYTLPKGRYSGGTVYVDSQEKEVTATSSAQTITASANKVLKKVTVPAIQKYQIKTGVFPSGMSGESSWTQQVSFTPHGAALIRLDSTFGNGVICGVASISSNGNYGTKSASSNPGSAITTGISLGSTSVTFTGSFEGDYEYIIWGK